ncbi:MAG: DUF6525 family protein [Shimia sp.]
MAANVRTTKLGCKRPARDALAAYDRLPPHLRRWMAQAALPWAARSVLRSYERALRRSGDPAAALRALDLIEARTVARDAATTRIGRHPCRDAAEAEAVRASG